MSSDVFLYFYFIYWNIIIFFIFSPLLSPKGVCPSKESFCLAALELSNLEKMDFKKTFSSRLAGEFFLVPFWYRAGRTWGLESALRAKPQLLYSFVSSTCRKTLVLFIEQHLNTVKIFKHFNSFFFFQCRWGLLTAPFVSFFKNIFLKFFYVCLMFIIVRINNNNKKN